MLAIAVVALLAAVEWASPRHVYACSAGPDFDAIAASDVIVEGTMLGWEPATSDPVRAGKFIPVRVEMAVERVWKGNVVGQSFEFIDRTSLIQFNSTMDRMWAGSSGACGALNSDPTGDYAVMGFHLTDTGTLESNLLLTFFIGDEPGGQGASDSRFDYDQAIAFLEAHPDISAPSLGSGPLRSNSSGVALIVGIIAATIGVVLLAASVIVRGTARRNA